MKFFQIPSFTFQRGSPHRWHVKPPLLHLLPSPSVPLPPTQRVSLWQRVRSAVEPSVPVSTLVNDGTVFLVLAVWAGWQSLAAEPTLPLCGALAYAVWKLYDKRTRRDPDGPFFGGNAIWGALAAGMAGLVLGGFAVFGAVRFMPIPASVGTGAPFAFLLVLLLGVIALYIR